MCEAGVSACIEFTAFFTDEQLDTDGPPPHTGMPHPLDDMPHPLDDMPRPLVDLMEDCPDESNQELLSLYRKSFAILKTVAGWAQPGAESAEISQDSEENAESAGTSQDSEENVESEGDYEGNADSAESSRSSEENAESANTGLDTKENTESAVTTENAESASGYEETAESAGESVHLSDDLSVGGANSPHPPSAVSGPTSERSNEEPISQRLRSRVQPVVKAGDHHHPADSSGTASTDEEPVAKRSGWREDSDSGPSKRSGPISQRLRNRTPQVTRPAYSSGTASTDEQSVIRRGRLREGSASDEEPVTQRREGRGPVRVVAETSSDEQSNQSNRSDKVRRVSQRLRRPPPSPDSSLDEGRGDRQPIRKRRKTHNQLSNQNDKPIALRLRRRRVSPRVIAVSDATPSDESLSEGQLVVSGDNKESSNENEAPISQRLRRRRPRQQHLHTQLQPSAVPMTRPVTRSVTRPVTRLVSKAFVDSDSSDDERSSGREIPQTARECESVEHILTPHSHTLTPHITHSLHTSHILHILTFSTHSHTQISQAHTHTFHTPSHTHTNTHTHTHHPAPSQHSETY